MANRNPAAHVAHLLRMDLVWDNLVGRYQPEFKSWRSYIFLDLFWDFPALCVKRRSRQKSPYLSVLSPSEVLIGVGFAYVYS
jgi:hypothetical protein